MLLVVEDVAPGERRLRQMPDQRLLPQRQRRELVGVELDDRRVVNLLEEVLPVAFGAGRRRCRSGVVLAAGAAGNSLQDARTQRV